MRKLLFLLLTGLSFMQPAFALRIVSLSPSLTKNMCYLGAEKELVGCTSYCQTAGKVPVVASAIKVNVEKVLVVKPDLVVATSMTAPESLASLRKMGVRVVVYSMAKSYDELSKQFLDLGKQIGKSTQATVLLNSTNKRIQAICARKTPSRRIFIQLGCNPLFGVIPHTFMHDYIRLLGSVNILEGMSSGTVTREAVLTKDPEYLFIVTMGIVGEEERRTWSRYTSMKACKNNKIIVLDSDKACNPTPVTFAETLDQIQKSLL